MENRYVPKMRKLPGYPTGDWFINPNWFKELDALMAQNQDSLFVWHEQCANLADRKMTGKAYPIPYNPIPINDLLQEQKGSIV